MSVYSSSRRVFAWLAVGLTLVVSACGFQLQGASPLAFDTLAGVGSRKHAIWCGFATCHSREFTRHDHP